MKCGILMCRVPQYQSDRFVKMIAVRGIPYVAQITFVVAEITYSVSKITFVVTIITFAVALISLLVAKIGTLVAEIFFNK